MLNDNTSASCLKFFKSKTMENYTKRLTKMGLCNLSPFTAVLKVSCYNDKSNISL